MSLPDSISRQNRLFAQKKETHLLCSHRHITVIAGPTCLIAHLLAPPDRAASQGWTPGEFLCTCTPRCVGANNAKQTHTEKVSAIRNPEKGSFGTEYSTSPLGMGLGPTDRARNQPFFGGVPHPPDPTDRANRPSFFLKDPFFCGWGQKDFFFAAGSVTWMVGIRWGVRDRTNRRDFGGVGLPRPGYPTGYRDPSLVSLVSI